MKKITLSAIANQSFNVTVEDYTYTLTFRSAGSFMLCDIAIDGETIQQGLRIVPGSFLIPYKHQEVAGNFVLITDDYAEADYTEFESTQFLYYYTEAELSEYRGES